MVSHAVSYGWLAFGSAKAKLAIMTIASPLLLSLLFTASMAGDAAEEAVSPECYDVAVKAKVIDQVPSIMPICDDCIIMHWPWFLDLKVAKVLEGKLGEKVVTVLNMQHTYRRSRYGAWWLRRNTAGGLNVVQRGTNGEPPVRCGPTMPPVKPYIQSKNKTLDELRSEGIGEYRHYPKL
jgi:hypothetical protein